MAVKFSFQSDLSDNISLVRFKVGDTIEQVAVVDDDTITALLAVNSNSILKTARDIAQHLWAKFAYEVTRQVDGFGSAGAREALTDKATQWRRLYEQLKSEVGGKSATGVGFFAGGVEIAENELQAENTAITQPQFGLGQFDNTDADNPDSTSDDELGLP